ncbi:MAG: hypothetical protein LBQ02_00125 [Candidatus Nomurabacteria bacterium]|nr:hypothetical protein [Candidatus Nomurabacteria bacterium]
MTLTAFVFTKNAINPEAIVGDTLITRQDIESYEKALQQITDQNLGLVFSTEEKSLAEIAGDDLVLNAMLKYYAKPDHCNVQVTALDILQSSNQVAVDDNPEQVLDQKYGSYSQSNPVRIRAENEVYKDKLKDCLIGSKQILSVFVQYYDRYFTDEDGEFVEERVKAVQEWFSDELLPLFDSGAPATEIAAKATCDYVNKTAKSNPICSPDENYDDEQNWLWAKSQLLTVAKLETITEGVAYNDSSAPDELPDYFGEQVLKNEVAESLKEIGQNSGVITARDGTISILRLEATGGEIASYDSLINSIKKQHRALFGGQGLSLLPHTNPLSSTAVAAPVVDDCTDLLSGGVYGNHAKAFEVYFSPYDNPIPSAYVTVPYTISVDWPGYSLYGCQSKSGTAPNVNVQYNCMTHNYVKVELSGGWEFANNTGTSGSDSGKMYFGYDATGIGASIKTSESSAGGTSASIRLALSTGANSSSGIFQLRFWVKSGDTCTIHATWAPEGWEDKRVWPYEMIPAGTAYPWKDRGYISADYVEGCKPKPDPPCPIPDLDHLKASDARCCDPCSATETADCVGDPPTPVKPAMAAGSTETATSENGICAVNLGGAAVGAVTPDQACDPVNSNTATNPVPTQLGRPSDQLQFQLTMLKNAQILRENNHEIIPKLSGKSDFSAEKCYVSANFNGNMLDNDLDCQYVSGPNSTMDDAKERDSYNTIKDVCDNVTTINPVKGGIPSPLTAIIPPCGDQTNQDYHDLGQLSNTYFESNIHTILNADVGKKNIKKTITYYDKTLKVFTNCGLPPNDCADGEADVNPDNEDSEHNHKYTFEYKQRHPQGSGTNSYTWWTHPEYLVCPSESPCYWVGSPQSHTTKYVYWGSPAPTITSAMTGDSSYGGATGTGECPDGVMPLYDGSGTYDENEHRWSKVLDRGPISTNAQFNIPYNYELAPVIQATVPDGAMLIGGSDWNYDTWIDTLMIPNTEFLGNTFATLTRPGTKWKITEFYLNENLTDYAPQHWGENADGTANPTKDRPLQGKNSLGQDVVAITNGVADPCSSSVYNPATSQIQNVPNYQYRDADSGATHIHCRVVDDNTGSLNASQGASALPSLQNCTGDANYNRQNRACTNHTAHVADAPAGTKFCIGLSVMDWWSGNDGTDHANAYRTYGDGMHGEWMHLKPVCVSISKVPTMQVWGGGLYSEGPVTGRYAEKLNASAVDYSYWLNDPSTRNFPVNNVWKAFGSWSEYDAIGSVLGLSSGDATLKIYGSGAAFGYGLEIPQSPSGGTSTDGCKFSKISIKNTPEDCHNPSNTNMGKSTAFRGLAQRVALRYTNRVQGDEWVTGPTAKVDSITNTGYTASGNWVGGAITPKDGEVTFYHSTNGTDISGTNISKGKTVIVEINGKATITGNITYTNEALSSIYDIPQVLIFADDIDIAPSVTQIDAWLMVGLKGGNGTINTCANGIAEDTLIASNGGDSFSTKDNLYNHSPSAPSSANGNQSEQCRNRLKINGPVQAKQLRLLRSYGAGMGLSCRYGYTDGNIAATQWPNGSRTSNCGSFPNLGSGNFPYDSSTPAEVFNLRADAYLWAYKQVENYSQAFVTYQREVAPRY